MPTLAGIDTTIVYHDGVDSEQLKDLHMEQYYVHVDVINWFEEMLTNRLRELNCIKIIYERLYHFDINHVKCVEIYCDEQEWRTIASKDAIKISSLIADAKYKMPWRSSPTYYVHYTNSEIDEQIREKDLHKFLAKRYTMEVEWCGSHNLIVYEFEPTLTEDLLEDLEVIFSEWFDIETIFISDEFLFLKNTGPPQYKEVENIFVLTVFHDQLLSRLTIQDILSLELANKDHRFESYNSDLDRDIQMHLRKRLNLSNEHTKLDTYVVTEFNRLQLLKYFVYKYRDRLTKVRLRNKILISEKEDEIAYEYGIVKRKVLNKNSAFRLDVISPENINVCSVTVLRHDNGNLIEPDSITIKEIRLDGDIRFGLYNEDISMIGRPPYFIEITFRAKCKSDRLSDFLHTVLEKVLSDFDGFSDSIIQLRSYNNRISSCILNSFIEKDYEFEIGFKNINFHFNRLVGWLCKCSRLRRVSFTACILLFNNKRSKMLRMMVYQDKDIDRYPYDLTFRNMKFDIPTLSALYHLNCSYTVFDGCCLSPSSSAIVPLKFTDPKIEFKNMKIDLQLIIPLLSATIEFNKCQIQPIHDQIFQSNSIAESSRYDETKFTNMDIDAEVLIQISEYARRIELERCRILSNESVNTPSNYPINSEANVSMRDVEIEPTTAVKMLKRLNQVGLTKGQFKCTDPVSTNNLTKFKSELFFNGTSITPEFLKGFKYLDFDNAIFFVDCPITNQTLIDIWTAAPRCKRIHVTGAHKIDYYFYIEVIAKLYENRIDEMLNDLRDGVAVSLINLFNIEWSDNPLNHKQIDWHNIRIKSVLVNDGTVKLEYFRNDEVFDLFHDQNDLPNDSDECEVDYC